MFYVHAYSILYYLQVRPERSIPLLFFKEIGNALHIRSGIVKMARLPLPGHFYYANVGINDQYAVEPCAQVHQRSQQSTRQYPRPFVTRPQSDPAKQGHLPRYR
jgi:hypothetical protein